jgi:TolB-like protein
MSTNVIKTITFLAFFMLGSTLLGKDNSTQNSKLLKGQPHGILDQAITELADELLMYNKINGINEEIAITSFVDLHQLNKTTHFGRTLSEAFFDELFTRGFNVTDFRGQETISVNREGEYFLTRDIKLLDKDVISAYILVGTYSYFENKIQINARIIDNMSGKVLASARSNYMTDDCRVLENCKKPRHIQIVKHDSKKIKIQKDYAKVDNNEMSKKQFFIRKQELPQDNNEEIVITKTPYPLVNLIK